MTRSKNNKTNTKSNADRLREEFYKGMAELREGIKELKERQEKTDVEIDKLLKAQEKTDAQIAETDKLVKELSRNVGGINNSLGKISEDMSIPQIERMFDKFKISIEGYYPDVRRRYNGGTKVKEVDLILVGTFNNKDITIVVETKLRYKKTKEIDKFNEFLSKEFKQIFKEYEKHDVMGCVCALGYGTGLEKYAERLGLFVMKPVKGVMDIINKPDFKVRIV